MKRFNKLLCFMLVFIAVMIAFCTVSFAANVGDVLKNPENGWRRYDDSNEKFKYTGTFTVETALTGYYNSTVHVADYTIIDAVVNFKFYGSKLRIIGSTNAATTHASPTVTITIDGTSYTYSTIGTELTRAALVYEKMDLDTGIHEVSITNHINNKQFAFDAIDIDDNGYLIDFYAPSNLKAIPGNSVVDLSWDAVEGATSYIVKRSLTPGGPYDTITTSSAITYTDTNVTNGTTYYYVVSAINAGGESPNSNEVSATPTAPQHTNQLKLVLEVNQEKQLSISEELSDNKEMDWISSNPSIAAVDANGKVKALKPGTTVITCTSKDKSYTESINVLVVDLEYQLAVDLSIGDTCRLTIDDLTNTTFVTWSSYDPTIATVSDKGKVTAVSEGLTYVIASDKDGKEIGRIYIRVRQ